MEPGDLITPQEMTPIKPEPNLEWVLFFAEARRLAALARTRREAAKQENRPLI